MAIPAIIGAAGISALGSLVGGLFSSDANEEAAQKQMEFQMMMANSVHQREVDDLRKAGLNPMLTGKYGGSPAPAGAMHSTPDIVTPAVNSALAASQSKAQIELLEAQADKARAEAAHTAQQTLTEVHRPGQVEAETDITRKRTPGAHYESELKSSELRRELLMSNLFDVAKSSRLGREFNTNMMIRDPRILHYLLDEPTVRSELRLRSIVSRLHELEENRARNLSEAEKTWWKRDVAPFLPDAARSVGSAYMGSRLLGR